MEYFRILNLAREPFSTSPDPDLFYRARGHADCLHELEISIRLRRGLCVVVGPVGVGKTTICRQLLRELADDERVDARLTLDPTAESRGEFLNRLWAALSGTTERQHAAPVEDLRERLKKLLFQRGVQEGRTLVLLIDEGQKLHPGDLEVLRELGGFNLQVQHPQS